MKRVDGRASEREMFCDLQLLLYATPAKRRWHLNNYSYLAVDVRAQTCSTLDINNSVGERENSIIVAN